LNCIKKYSSQIPVNLFFARLCFVVVLSDPDVVAARLWQRLPRQQLSRIRRSDPGASADLTVCLDTVATVAVAIVCFACGLRF